LPDVGSSRYSLGVGVGKIDDNYAKQLWAYTWDGDTDVFFRQTSTDYVDESTNSNVESSLNLFNEFRFTMSYNFPYVSNGFWQATKY